MLCIEIRADDEAEDDEEFGIGRGSHFTTAASGSRSVSAAALAFALMSAARGRIAAFITDAASRFNHIPWRSIGSDALDRASLVLKAACFVHVVNTYIVGIAFVRGPSMLPTINLTGDVVAVERITPRRGTVEVGDVVILISPENPRKTVAKRVLGLQGDAVTFFVDPIHGNATRTVVVPVGHVWVQGDNIYSSRDSRQFGPVPYGLIQGRAFCKVWPPEAVGFLGEKY